MANIRGVYLTDADVHTQAHECWRHHMPRTYTQGLAIEIIPYCDLANNLARNEHLETSIALQIEKQQLPCLFSGYPRGWGLGLGTPGLRGRWQQQMTVVWNLCSQKRVWRNILNDEPMVLSQEEVRVKAHIPVGMEATNKQFTHRFTLPQPTLKVSCIAAVTFGSGIVFVPRKKCGDNINKCIYSTFMYYLKQPKGYPVTTSDKAE